ncbi:unnamed protein product [Mycena citricolor]|uniref:Telomeric single stranded DNA binding POT1/Cdc13 domain-containing protein n=1 Tax=Mycena citricolor TaxID=2018698 RepID=A0AAD2HMF3_9AGAR|nr:unnamed protein product [Mycena citricolor]
MDLKRSGDPLEHGRKRRKLGHNGSDDCSLLTVSLNEYYASDLMEWKAGTTGGYIQAQIVMKWPPTSKSWRIKLENFSSAAGLLQFELDFSGRCPALLATSGVQFKLGQKLRLSLDGATTIRKKSTSSSKTIPVLLRYENGVDFEFVGTGSERNIEISLWHRPEPELPPSPGPSAPSSPRPSARSDDWFMTPITNRRVETVIQPPIVMDVIQEDPSVEETEAVRHNSAPTKVIVPLKVNDTTSKPDLAVPDGTRVPLEPVPSTSMSSLLPLRPIVHSNVPNAASDVVEGSSTKRKSKSSVILRTKPPLSDGVPEIVTHVDDQPSCLNKKQRKNLKRRQAAKLRKALPLPEVASSVVQITPVSAQGSAPVLPPTNAHHSVAASEPPTEPRLPPPSGFATVASMEKCSQVGVTYSVIGVVSSRKGVAKTSKQDWYHTFNIVDPSTIEAEPYGLGMLVTCFHPKENGVPAVDLGDVVFLVGLKARETSTSRFGGTIRANGYADKLQWAVYNASQGRIGHGESSASDRHCFQPNDVEREYSITLGDWWQKIQEKRQGTVNQISSVIPPPKTQRRHVLLSETQDVEYFDCTVEASLKTQLHVETLRKVQILQAYENSPTYSIFCTDYTELAGGKAIEADWCPPIIKDKVLRIEAWDAAFAYAQKMIVGEFYLLRNVRMRRNLVDLLEAKIVETKISRLDPDKEPTDHLAALLQRKQALGVTDDDDVTELKLISDCAERSLLQSLVELLHIDPLSNSIYVTDYTSHSKLPVFTESWAKNLPQYILRVYLHDEQQSMITRMVVGQFYLLSRMLVRERGATSEFAGTMGGSNRLILLVNPKSSNFEDKKRALLQRKEDVLKGFSKLPKLEEALQSNQTSRPVEQSPIVELVPKKPRRNCQSIRQMLESEGSENCFVYAKVVDFYPFRLEDAFIRVCETCDARISDKRVSCHNCEDSVVQAVCVLRLMIDDGERQLKVSVSGKVPVLDGLGAVFLRDDPEASRQFESRMKPLVGNIPQVHDRIVAVGRADIELSSPWLMMEIDHWERSDGRLVYGLRDYEK